MGIFGAKKEILVASTVYNMAGDIQDRPDYLKSLVAGNIISNTKFSMPETISEGYMNGPGINLRRFHRWAVANYGAIGVPNVEVLNKDTFDQATIQTELIAENPPPAGQTFTVTSANIRRYDIENFAVQHILNMGGGGLDYDWTVDRNPDGLTATITFPPEHGIGPYTFTLPFADDNYDLYFYITYQVVRNTPPGAWSKMWVYRIGSGNAVLDAIPQITVPLGNFVPFIPVRLDGNFLSDTHMPSTYDLAEKAYKKLTGQKFDSLVDKINENDDIDDIDHAFIVQGVALNCVENEGKKYIFRLFDYLLPYSNYRITDFNVWEEKLTSYTVTKFTYNGAYEAYEGDADAQYNYISMNDAPYYPSDSPLTALSIQATGLAGVAKLWFIVKWSGLSKFTGSGLKKPDAKVDEVWWTVGSSYVADPVQLVTSPSRIVQMDGEDQFIVELHWQKSATEWETLQFSNLRHENRVYSNKSIEITAKDALADADESGFIIPIHYETFRSMSLVESTQLAIVSSYLVFNSYEVVKQKWYTTTFFKIIVIVVVIAITIATAGTGAGLGAGILGTAASVGATLGFTGLMAVIVGAVANALAAMILTTLLSKAATAVFGDKIGMIIAAVASIIAMNVGSTLMSGGTLAQSWGNLMSASNIISMTSAVGNGIAGYMQAGAQDWLGKSQELIEQYEKESKKYTDMWLEQFGYGNFFYDPTMLTYESEEAFLSRTLMTGSDIADMTLDMITNFTDYTLASNTTGS